MRGIAAVVLGCALVAGAVLPWAPPAAATFLTDERIPTDDPIYRDLERLAARFGASPRFLSSRPLRRGEVLAFLHELWDEYPGEVGSIGPGHGDPAFIRARRALELGAPGSNRPLIAAKGNEGERVEISPYVSLLYSEDPRNNPEVNRDYRAGVTFAGALDSSVVLVADLYAGTASQGGRGTPNFGTSNALVEGVDFNTWVHEAYAEARLGRIRVLAGHAWLRWGPGRDGTLALSDAAPALDMIRAEVTAFKWWRLQWFISLLDPGPQTYLGGHRLEWTPNGCRVTVGLTELARFDGTSQAPLYTMPLVPYSFWEKRPKSGTAGAIPGDTSGIALAKNNVLWSADIAWIPRGGWRTWGELMVDDISFSDDFKPDMIGYQAGVEHRRPMRRFGNDALSLSLEYNRVNNYTYSAFHGHDFASDGLPIGFVLGPDVATLSGEIGYELGAAWEFRVRGEWRKKGEGAIGDFYNKPSGATADASAFQGVVTEETRAGGEIVYAPVRGLRLSASVGSSHGANDRHIAGNGRDEVPVALRGEFKW